jgi:hypothetical protein
MQEGPQKVYLCDGCIYHVVQNNARKCKYKHPRFAKEGKLIVAPLVFGEENYTPNWCPFLKKKI